MIDLIGPSLTPTNGLCVVFMDWRQECLQTLLNELNDLHKPSTKGLLICGQQPYEVLRNAALHPDRASSGKLQALIDNAHNMMRSASPLALFGWRRLYTDACLLQALVLLDSFTALRCISTLDHAIVVAGAAGSGRLDMIHVTIERIQSDFCPTDPFTGGPSTTVLRHDTQTIELPTAASQICALGTPPSFLAFQREYSSKPFILRGYAKEWPALRECPWSSAGYLRSVAGKGRIVPIEVGVDYRKDNWKQVLMDWDEFLSMVDFEDQPCAERDDDTIYLAQHNLMLQFPTLRDDIIIPDYVYASPASNYSEYKSPENDEQLLLNMWLGPKDTVSPAHTDPYHNLYVQVVGCKTVWLAPPENMFVCE